MAANERARRDRTADARGNATNGRVADAAANPAEGQRALRLDRSETPRERVSADDLETSWRGRTFESPGEVF